MTRYVGLTKEDVERKIKKDGYLNATAARRAIGKLHLADSEKAELRGVVERHFNQQATDDALIMRVRSKKSSGLSYKDIGEQCDVSDQTVRQLVKGGSISAVSRHKIDAGLQQLDAAAGSIESGMRKIESVSRRRVNSAPASVAHTEENSLMELIRAVKKAGIEKAFEVVKLLEAFTKESA
jgi:hypothetical protein